MPDSPEQQITQLAVRTLQLAADIHAASAHLEASADRYVREARYDLYDAHQDALDTARQMLGITTAWRVADASPGEGAAAASPERHLRGLAVRGVDLARDICVLSATLKAADERDQQAGWWLAAAANTARCIPRGILQAALILQRIASVPADACRMDMPVCPVHGGTLVESGRRTWCEVTGCPHAWDYCRSDIPCPAPVTHQLATTTGQTRRVCAGHSITERRRGAHPTPLDVARP
ncbi:hypothetical protein [Actinomadura harenae]|uniref:Uncharacterized protein n=1 Tax=Actinomadura harenae TaxID=2483351 RepID=A0A3M2M9N9_9ACTN|nr:hypothetical protein [Actinomadura harenae]RMI45315.1 hypothetical protein EBO15_10335 [Actinomadura harenae]